MKMATLPLLLCAVMLLSVSEGRRWSSFCPRGWALIAGRCLTYVPHRLTWAKAERNCLFLGGNLASVRSSGEHRAIQRFIFGITYKFGSTWIGGSNSAEKYVWLWSDGRRMKYTKWCPNEPDNYKNRERCLQMNYSGGRCWNDRDCAVPLPSVCSLKRSRRWSRG